MLKRKKSLRTFGKTVPINFKEWTPKILYRTKVSNVRWKCIYLYIYYSLAEKVGSSSGWKMLFVQFIGMATGIQRMCVIICSGSQQTLSVFNLEGKKKKKKKIGMGQRGPYAWELIHLQRFGPRDPIKPACDRRQLN